ncbi:3-methyl-2-oxobutanoate hydroxymethyltransferase [Bdellovibrionota bacterium FG-2]
MTTTPKTALTAQDFKNLANIGHKISMVTAYDTWSARIINESKIDCILVGDSGAMVMHGFSTTLPATSELMALHTAAVARGAPNKFIIGDMPFLSYRKGLRDAMNCVEALMRAGAHCVKLEGVEGHESIVSHIVQSGVPVMGHLGLTPQSVNSLGGMKVQAKQSAEALRLITNAKKLQELGCFSLVLECVPSEVAREVTAALSIPTIGIGAGPHTSGQVLVLQDLLGTNPGFKPKFLRTYLDLNALMRDALNHFDRDVKDAEFPSERESYTS